MQEYWLNVGEDVSNPSAEVLCIAVLSTTTDTNTKFLVNLNLLSTLPFVQSNRIHAPSGGCDGYVALRSSP